MKKRLERALELRIEWVMLVDTQSILRAFFDAENKRDWEKYRSFLSPDIVWVLHSKQTMVVYEKVEAYLSAIMEAYKNSDNTFVCEAVYKSSDGHKLVAILKNNLGERSCDIFYFRDDLIVEEHEFILG
ncbi:nuclear transport factor 2 family protein [Methylomusa anaerophila]|nr:nuclear transport factor 2 family protein [Methylomusa anaerophila]